MPQVHTRADVWIDFEITRDEGKGGHVVARHPGGGVGFTLVDGILGHGGEGGEEGVVFGVGDGG